MENNRKKFLDKVVEFLVKDTIIDYGDNHIYFPFFPSYSLYISDANLDYFFHLNGENRDWGWFDKGSYSQYCKDNYGLSHSESLYVWGIYIGIIKEKINTKSESLNESDDRRKKFLDKVVDFLVKDTKVDYDKRTLFFPFTYKRSLRQGTNNLTPFHKLLFDSYIPIDGFMEYIKELYDITSIEDITHVWETYKVIMDKIVFGDNATPLYFDESEKGSINEDSRQDLIDKVDERVKKYLDKVVDFILKETVIDFGIDKFNPVIKDEVLWYPPFSERPYSHRQSMYNTGANYDFNNYCQEVFSIYDEGEQLYVWERYRKLLEFKIRNMMINESDDKKQKYLNKILEWFVRDTIINYETSIIYYPFSSIGPTGKLLPSFFDNLKNKLSMTFPSDIHIYCRDTYGLNPDETKYIWDKYKKIIRDRYDKETMLYHLGKPINESDDKKQVYLDKVVDWLVRDTEIGNGYWFSPPYYYPGSMAGRTGFRSVYEHTLKVSNYSTYEHFDSGLASQLIYFKPYCLNNYGLTEDEIDYVWKEYMEKLYESNNWRF